MDLDFEDYLEADLPFIRTNPHEADVVEVIELDGTGNVLDVVTTNPCYLGALEDDYYLEPIIDETTDEMPFEMSELHSAEEGDYLDDLEELGITAKFGGSVGVKGLYGRGSVSTPTKTTTTAKKKSSAQIRAEFRRKRQRKIEAARKKARIEARAKKRKSKSKPKAKPRSWTGVKLAPGAKIQGAYAKAKKSLPRRVFEEMHAEKKLPQVVARPKLATAGVTCGCAQIGRIEKMLKKAATQRVATSEHRTLINQKKFRTRTIGQLRAILGRLSTRDRSRVIRAACGMGGG